jgi:V8-like Glu-specific endopeptidase
LDAFQGNSGSSVFNQKTRQIVGVLVRGEQDYERQNGCYVAKVCGENDCRGEDVMRISEIRKKLPEDFFRR